MNELNAENMSIKSEEPIVKNVNDINISTSEPVSSPQPSSKQTDLFNKISRY